ncbi:MAG: DUF4412 domain-containing protein [Vicinamibacterales bacterium]
MIAVIRGVSLASVLCAMAGTAQAADGLLMVSKVTSGTGAAQTSQVQIDGSRMRAESGPDGARQIVMFDGKREVLTLLDTAKRTYTELTKADLDALGGQRDAAMSQMQQQLKNLPPERRARVEAMMKGRGAAPAAPKMTYRKTGTDTVGRWTCVKYEGYAGTEKRSDVCTVDAKVLGLSAADFAVTEQMAAFFRKMVPGAASQALTIGTAEEQGFSGVPVRQAITIGGRQVTTEITEVTRMPIADAVFQVPAGYEKTTFGGPARGRRGGGDY